MKDFLRSHCIKAFFSDYLGYRKFYGGHWERWYVDLIYCDVWHDVIVCSLHPWNVAHGKRPTPICRGTPTCEDHGLN